MLTIFISAHTFGMEVGILDSVWCFLRNESGIRVVWKRGSANME